MDSPRLAKARPGPRATGRKAARKPGQPNDGLAPGQKMWPTEPRPCTYPLFSRTRYSARCFNHNNTTPPRHHRRHHRRRRDRNTTCGGVPEKSTGKSRPPKAKPARTFKWVVDSGSCSGFALAPPKHQYPTVFATEGPAADPPRRACPCYFAKLHCLASATLQHVVFTCIPSISVWQAWASPC